MNILIINGSPRKKGLISQMLDMMREVAEKKGDQVQTVYINDLSIKPCIGCMACRTKLKCSIAEDDSQLTLRMIQDADAVIMGAPCYWGNIPGQMKLHKNIFIKQTGFIQNFSSYKHIRTGNISHFFYFV